MFCMSKLIPFKKFSKKSDSLPFISQTSVIVDEKGIPLGFVFGRDSFISFLEHIDEKFEEASENPQKVFDNPAGRLIDLIEEQLPLKPSFVKNLKVTLRETKKSDWIPLKEIKQSLHV